MNAAKARSDAVVIYRRCGGSSTRERYSFGWTGGIGCGGDDAGGSGGCGGGERRRSGLVFGG